MMKLSSLQILAQFREECQTLVKRVQSVGASSKVLSMAAALNKAAAKIGGQ